MRDWASLHYPSTRPSPCAQSLVLIRRLTQRLLTVGEERANATEACPVAPVFCEIPSAFATLPTSTTTLMSRRTLSLQKRLPLRHHRVCYPSMPLHPLRRPSRVETILRTLLPVGNRARATGQQSNERRPTVIRIIWRNATLKSRESLMMLRPLLTPSQM